MATLRRLVLATVAALLVLGGIIVGVTVGTWYYDGHRGWYVGIVAVLEGVAAALGAWFVSALIGLLVEIADSARTIAGAVDR